MFDMMYKTVFLLMLVSFLSACASTKVFKDQSAKNIEVIIEKDKGSIFNATEVNVEVWKLEADCKTILLGKVDNESPKYKIGLQPGKLAYINFRFFSSGMFSNDNSMTYGSLIIPREGYNYQLKASYVEGIYNLEIFEKKPGKKTRRLETRHYDDCKNI